MISKDAMIRCSDGGRVEEDAIGVGATDINANAEACELHIRQGEK